MPIWFCHQAGLANCSKSASAVASTLPSGATASDLTTYLPDGNRSRLIEAVPTPFSELGPSRNVP